MTVRELIERLQREPPEAEVSVALGGAQTAGTVRRAVTVRERTAKIGQEPGGAPVYGWTICIEGE